MSRITYGIVKEIYCLGKESRISYGIVAYGSGNEDSIANIVASVHDITTDKKSLEKLVSLCNRLQISTIHLSDIVEDYLAV